MWTELKEKAYQILMARRHAYRQTFKSEHGQRVLEDLSLFCRAAETTFHEDPRAHALLEGRREVWLRVLHHLQLSPDQLFQIYTKAATRDGD